MANTLKLESEVDVHFSRDVQKLVFKTSSVGVRTEREVTCLNKHGTDTGSNLYVLVSFRSILCRVRTRNIDTLWEAIAAIVVPVDKIVQVESGFF